MFTVTNFYLFQQINLKLSMLMLASCNFNEQHVFIAVIYR